MRKHLSSMLKALMAVVPCATSDAVESALPYQRTTLPSPPPLATEPDE